jgi:hypothetical protein
MQGGKRSPCPYGLRGGIVDDDNRFRLRDRGGEPMSDMTLRTPRIDGTLEVGRDDVMNVAIRIPFDGTRGDGYVSRTSPPVGLSR